MLTIPSLSGSTFRICMVFTTEGFLEATTESWPEWNLNP